VLVVDASFLAAVLLEETHSEFARSVLAREAEPPRAAPGLLSWEFGNILWKKLRRGELAETNLQDVSDFLDEMSVELHDSPGPGGLADLVLLASTYDLTVYDAAYLALALDLQADLATTDRDLARAAQAAGLAVHSPFA
jgi:predicted nucleic acid-binding protein